MTTNRKPNDLPTGIEDMHELTRPLIIDRYLSKRGVLRRLCDLLDVRRPDGDDGDDIRHAVLARIYCAAAYTDSDDVDARAIEQDLTATNTKEMTIQHLAALYGFPYRDDQPDLLKSQAVFMLIVEATGDPPGTFELPTDPDIDLVDGVDSIPDIPAAAGKAGGD